MYPSHIFIVGPYTGVGRLRESAIFSGFREVTVSETRVVLQFYFHKSPSSRRVLQNNDRRKYVVSVMVRSRLGTALYTVVT